MFPILAIVACCAIVPVAMAAVALVNSLGKREKFNRQNHPNDGPEVALPPPQEGGDGR